MLVMDGVQRRAAISPVRPLVTAQERARPAYATAQALPSYGWGRLDGIRMPRPVEEPAPASTVDEPSRWRYYQAATFASLAIPMALVGSFGLSQRLHLDSAKPSAAASVQTAPAAAATAAKPAPVSTAPVVQSPTPAQIQNLLNGFVAGQPAPFGIYVKDLKSGAEASVNPDHVFESASLYKLFVAQGILKLVDNGQLSLGSPAGGGTGMSIQDCMQLMITISSNDCGHALGGILGWSNYDQTLHDFGYHSTSLGVGDQEPSTTATDVGQFYTRLYSGTLLSPSSSGLLLTFLKNQQVNNRLPAGLPVGTMIAHKTGDLDGFVHDAGIVYGPKTDYLVVVESGPWNAPANAPAAFADLSTKLYQQFNQ